MKPIIVSESLNNTGDGRPFTGRSGDRLQQLMGVLSYPELQGYFELVSLCPEEFSPRLARVTAQALLVRVNQRLQATRNRSKRLHHPTPHDSCHIILCGRKVQRAFQVDIPLFSCHTERGLKYIYLWSFPHPSGLNRYWNSGEQVRRAELFIRRISSGCIPTQ